MPAPFPGLLAASSGTVLALRLYLLGITLSSNCKSIIFNGFFMKIAY
jgi:hypothetical protein